MKRNALLHVCCGVCSIAPVRELAREFDVTGWWYNPNIQPFREYQARLQTCGYAFQKLGAPLLIEDSWDILSWFEEILPAQKQGRRCRTCWRIRLRSAARAARDGGGHAFTTTLLVSPHQDHEEIRRIGEQVARETGVEFLYRDFRPLYREAGETARAWNLYHQNYCGCLFSEEERFRKREKR